MDDKLHDCKGWGQKTGQWKIHFELLKVRAQPSRECGDDVIII